ncbi:unnamed protein product [Symbiodinium natans]|uniref:Post-SET domain-containing protein n=1 Tax=Symbiodinium natans TaxID=878477 RepID=A0A812TZ04_9DINO|nr:unnamed protein product [Symbiodinium natans]
MASFACSQLGNLLDEIDGGSGDKVQVRVYRVSFKELIQGKDLIEHNVKHINHECKTKCKSCGASADVQGSLANSLGGLLTSASQAAGSVASSSTNAAKAQFDAITSLLGEDEEEAEEVPGEAQGSRSNGVPEPAPSPSVPSTRAGVVSAEQPPDEVPEASPAPSTSEFVAQGWSFEALWCICGGAQCEGFLLKAGS